MTRTLYLAVYSNGRKPAHVAVFIPTGDQGDKGKIIHVVGNPATGFFLQFKRNYDFALDNRKYQIITLATVDDRLAKDTVGNGEPTEDTIARDRLESAATVVQPPGRTANPFDPAARNCQNWMEEYIESLVKEGYVSDDAASVFQNAPKFLLF